MSANWIQETTTTTGTGIIALAGAVSGLRTFSSEFKDQQLVAYTIEDGTSRESGLGTFTVSGTTLARSTVLETLVAGTYNNLTPTAISLSGSAVVSYSASAIDLMSASDMSANEGGDDIIYDVFTPIITRNSRSLFNNRTYLMPFWVPAPVKLTGLGVEILTLATGAADQELGLYIKDTTDNSYTLLDRTGNVDVSSTGTTGFISAAFDGGNLFLTPGMYWIGQSTNVSTGSIQGINYSTYFQHPYSGQLVDEPIVGYYADGTYSAGIPSAVTAAETTAAASGVFPLIYGVRA